MRTPQVKHIPLKFLFVIFTIVFALLLWKYMDENEIGMLTLDDIPHFGNLTPIFNKEFLKDNVIGGEFQSKYNKLGMVGIRFETFNRINDDLLEFRIKETGQSDWYYTASYKTDQFQPQKLFFFGLPPIEDSQSRTYRFELKSLFGSRLNSVAMSSISPNFVGRHVYTINYFLKHPFSIVGFSFQKVINLFKLPQTVLHIEIYSLPLIFILFYALTKRSNTVAILTIAIIVAWDLFFSPVYFDYIYFSVLFIWFLLVANLSLNSKTAAEASLVFLSITVFSTIKENYLLVNKSTTWAILFILFSFAQKTIEGNKETENGVKFLPNFIFMNVKKALLIMLILINSSEGRLRKFPNLASKITRLMLVLIESRKKRSEKVSKLTDKAIRFTDKETRRLKIIFKATSLFALAYSIRIIYQNFFKYFKVYNDYYPVNQFNLFFFHTGIYLILLVFVSICLFMTLIKKIPWISKIFLAVLICLATIPSGKVIYDITTSFKNQVIIWKVRGNGLSEPWFDVFIDGRNLGDPPFIGKVTINGVEQRIMRWTNNEVIFRTNPLVTKNGKIKVITYDGRTSNNLDFRYSGNR